MIDVRSWGVEPELQEGEWRRPPRIMHMELQSGVLETYQASPRPQWTTDPPEHPGFWWVRVPGHDPLVVEVYDGRGGRWFRWSDVSPQRVPMTRADGVKEGLFWSDRAIPLPEPRP